jgi:ATP-binding cassette subfamily B protein IrtB
MLESLRIITGNRLNKLTVPTLWNALQYSCRGVPYSFLYLILLELFANYEDPRNGLNVTLLGIYVVGLIACLVLQLFITKKAYDSIYVSSYSLVADARIRLGEHLRKLPMGFFKTKDPGDATALLLQDMDKVESTFGHSYPDLISCIAFPAIMAVFLLIADWRLSLAMLASVAIAIPVLVLCLRIMKRFSLRQIDARNNAASRTMEYVQGIKAIKAYNQTGVRFSRLDEANLRMRKECIRLEAVPGPFILSYMFILEMGFVAALLLGTYYVLGGTLTVPIFLLFLVLGYQFFEPLKQLSMFIAEMRYMTVAGERISDVLATQPLPEPPEAAPLDRFDIEFERVTFAYGDKDVLKNVSLRMRENSVTALVGPSGSGKTTVTNLIARFWDVNEGEVRVGGRNVKDLPTEKLLSYMSMVFQDVYLFNDTVRNNIKIGRPDATDEEIVAAAKVTRCHEFIEKLPQKYDTMVGEGGCTLSGGEKQRISIARAILKDAPIILLDEATASLDPENEMLIQQAIGALVRSKTVVVIAHRLNTITSADQIIVLDKGEIVERGKHEDLMEKGGLYRHLWDEQQKAHGWKLGVRSSSIDRVTSRASLEPGAVAGGTSR